MLAFLRESLFGSLAAASLVAGCEMTNPAPSLLGIPERVLDDLVQDVGCGDLRAEDQNNLLRLLAADPRAEVRQAAAEGAVALAGTSPEPAECLLGQLAADRDCGVRLAAAASLSQLVDRASALDRVGLLSRWVLSPSSAERQAAACALAAHADVLGSAVMVLHLSRDANPAVRRIAMEAALVHFAQDPYLLEQSAFGTMQDRDRRTRCLARKALRRAARIARAA
jgi:hypothetical protein